MPGYRLATPAKRDLVEILNYLLEVAGGRIALKAESSLRKTFHTLALYPQMGHRRPDLTDKPVLFLAHGSYLVVYRADEGAVVIIALLHASRDAEAVLRERVV